MFGITTTVVIISQYKQNYFNSILCVKLRAWVAKKNCLNCKCIYLQYKVSKTAIENNKHQKTKKKVIKKKTRNKTKQNEPPPKKNKTKQKNNNP